MKPSVVNISEPASVKPETNTPQQTVKPTPAAQTSKKKVDDEMQEDIPEGSDNYDDDEFSDKTPKKMDATPTTNTLGGAKPNNAGKT